MPRIDDHPLRLHRLYRGIGQISLAKQTGLNRSTISSIEEGRTVTVNPATLSALEAALLLHRGQLEAELAEWETVRRARGPVLNPHAVALLATPPPVVQTAFKSFVGWRKVFASSPTAFASMLGVNRQVITGYESGIRVNGMPDPLSHALLTVLKVSNDYLLALQRLPPTEE